MSLCSPTVEMWYIMLAILEMLYHCGRVRAAILNKEHLWISIKTNCHFEGVSDNEKN